MRIDESRRPPQTHWLPTISCSCGPSSAGEDAGKPVKMSVQAHDLYYHTTHLFCVF